MLVSKIYSNTQFGGLIPIQKYEGILLKLTKDDIQRIANIRKSITQLECELYQLCRKYDTRKLTDAETNFYCNKRLILEYHKESLLRQIEEIKINRLNMQKEFS